MTPLAARHPVVLAITGASGAPYAVRLLQQLVLLQVPTWLIVSSHGFRLLATESDIPDVQTLRAHVGAEAFDACVTVFDDNDRGAAPVLESRTRAHTYRREARAHPRVVRSSNRLLRLA